MATTEDSHRFSDHFTSRRGYLYCEDVRLSELREAVSHLLGRPCPTLFVYSKAAIENNMARYTSALAQLTVPAQLNYAVKANWNLELLRLLRSQGCCLTLVSGHELLMSLEAGFPPSSMLLNGNGKADWERELAIKSGCLINMDSEFDLRQTAGVAQRLDTTARVLLRVNPDIDAKVHPYVSTGLAGSKFGVGTQEVEACLESLARHPQLRLVGLHCHLGSTITEAAVFRSCIESLLKLRDRMEKKGYAIEILNIGGGLGIDYRKHERRTRCANQEDSDTLAAIAALVQKMATALAETGDAKAAAMATKLTSRHQDYVAAKISRAELEKEISSVSKTYPRCCDNEALLQAVLDADTPVASVEEVTRGLQEGLEEVLGDQGRQGSKVSLILEPGRTLVANSCVLLTTVLGTKTTGTKRLVVTDGAMTEVMRPCLYHAYHHVELATPTQAPDPTPHLVDVVGPVCESADFLAKERFLATPHEGCALAVFDVGAYCSSMASNYNLRMRPAEVLVSGTSWRLIRRPDTLEDLLRPFRDLPAPAAPAPTAAPTAAAPTAATAVQTV